MARPNDSKEQVPEYIADYDVFLSVDEWERRNGPIGEYIRNHPNLPLIRDR